MEGKEMNLPNLLAYQSRKYPDKEGIITLEERITYKEWNNYVNQLAAGFIQAGMKEEDKVVLFMPNTKEFLYVYFAVQRAGGITVPINAKLAAAEVDYIIDHSDAVMIVIDDQLYAQGKRLKERQNFHFIKTGLSNNKWLSLDEMIKDKSNEEVICNRTEENEASILYTSGTTGNPKGVVFTYQNILTVATTICIEMTMKPSSRILHMMPLSHSAPLHLFMAAGLYVGAAHVVVPAFTPELLLETVAREKITHFFGAPIAYLAAAKHPDIGKYDLSSMNYWVYGGAPLSKTEVAYIQQQFSANRFFCVYGLTEAGPNGTLLLAEEHKEKAGSIGRRAAVNCEIKLVDESGKEVEKGSIGEIVLSGEGTMKAYYKEPELTDETLKDGWLYTGDMGRQDEDGFFWVVDRKKDIIISGGVNIFPQEIEKLLLTHPKIADAAIVGIPNPDWGETAKAYIVLKEDMEDLEAECRNFLKEKTASFKIPKLFEKREKLPRNLTGKLLKTQLREENIIIDRK